MTKPAPTRSRRRRRRWMMLLAALAIVPAVVLAALPWALSTAAARRRLLARANRALAPGRLELASLRFSWFGPTRMSGFVLRDPQGDRVVESPRATWDRNLRQILLDRPRLGTLTLDRARLDVERRDDGSIDLYEALKPVLGRDPETDLKVVVDRGSLRFRAAGQPVPVTADDVALSLAIPAAPAPIAWDLRLANSGADGPARLKIEGTYERSKPGSPRRSRSQYLIEARLSVQVTGERWPWTIAVAGVVGVRTARRPVLRRAEGRRLDHLGRRRNRRTRPIRPSPGGRPPAARPSRHALGPGPVGRSVVDPPPRPRLGARLAQDGRIGHLDPDRGVARPRRAGPAGPARDADSRGDRARPRPGHGPRRGRRSGLGCRGAGLRPVGEGQGPLVLAPRPGHALGAGRARGRGPGRRASGRADPLPRRLGPGQSQGRDHLGGDHRPGGHRAAARRPGRLRRGRAGRQGRAQGRHPAGLVGVRP